MLKKTITYENLFTGEQITEDHYFHISKATLVEMEMENHKLTFTKDGETHTGLRAKLMRIANSDDGAEILAGVRMFVHRSYGIREGDRFIKTPELWNEFSASEAYSQLIFDLCTDAAAAAEFINGVIPSNLDKIAAEVAEKAKIQGTDVQALATAQRETATVEPVEEVVDVPEPTLADRIAAATSENPVVLTEAELAEIDSDELKSGLATGRIKLS